MIIAHISDPHIRRKGHLLHHMINNQPLGFVLEPPGYLLHVKDDGAMVTHTCTTGKFRGPYDARVD